MFLPGFDATAQNTSICDGGIRLPNSLKILTACRIECSARISSDVISSVVIGKVILGAQVVFEYCPDCNFFIVGGDWSKKGALVGLDGFSRQSLIAKAQHIFINRALLFGIRRQISAGRKDAIKLAAGLFGIVHVDLVERKARRCKAGATCS